MLRFLLQCPIYTDHFSPESALIAALIETDSAVSDWFFQNQKFFQAFIAQANRPARLSLSQNKNEDAYTIVILTTSASGGNHSVAYAIENFLSASSHIRCIVVDVEAIARETDLIMLATGAITYDGIYERQFQQI